MTRKSTFKFSATPTIWFKENRIESEVTLSADEIKALAPTITGLTDFLLGAGVNVQIEGEITIRIIDLDLYTGREDGEEASE